MVFAFSGCKQEEADTKPQDKPEPVPEEKVEEESYEFTYPLTGIGTNEDIDRRVVAVMINNHPKARPQSGLAQADIVYEVLAEGDLTRFLAFFQSEIPEKVGPVRSARDYYIELAQGYDALYVCHGNSPEAKEMMDRGVVDNLNGLYYDGTLFKRADFRKAPHNSYITYDNIEKGADKRDYAMTQTVPSMLFYTEDELKQVDNGTRTANEVDIRYSSRSYAGVTFRYDEQTGKYERYSADEQTIDYETKDPVLLDNLFIVETRHRVIDDAGRREIDLVSGGKGYLIQKGVVTEVEWKNVDGRIVPFENGIEAKFVPGKTWVNLIPTSPGLDGMVIIS